MKSSEKLPLNIECDPGNDSDSSSSSSSPRLDNLQEAEALIQTDLQIAKTNTAEHKKSKKRKRQIIFNVSDTKYEVVRYVGKEIFQWKLSFESDGRWDVFWTDGAVHPETLARMRSYQKINHFPGMYSLARKNHLGRYLMKMRKAFPEEYKFFPRTFLLPAEYSEFRAQFNKKNHTFIVKPEAGCQGRGIFLTRTFESVEPGEHYVVQKYIEKPFLIDGLKFDMRVYVLLAGCDPLRIYIYEEGLARFATEPYVQPGGKNLGNMCMHLTNYAINKNNPKFVFNTSSEENNQGHKRSLKAVMKMLESQGHDVKKLWREIKKLAIKTFCSVQPILAHYYKACQSDDFHNNMCFEVLGFDIMLDEDLKPWLIEVNHTPSFTTDTPLDRNIKMNVIKDTLKLMNISLEAKKKYKKAKRAQYKQRILSGKFVRLTAEERQAEIEKAQKERDEWENQNLGGFEKVYPIEDPSQAEEKYEDFLKEAHRWWGEWTGTTIKRAQKKEPQPTKIPPTGYVRRSTPLRQDNLVRELSATVTQKFRPIDKNNRALSFVSPIRSALMQSGIGSESESKNMEKILTTPRALSTERSGKDGNMGSSFEDVKKEEIKNLKKSQLYYSQEFGFNQECNEIVGEDDDEEDRKERYRLKVKNIEELEENVLLMEKMQSRPQMEKSDEIENNQRNSQRYFFRIRSNNGKQGLGEQVVIKVPAVVESKEPRGILDPNIEPKNAFQRNQKNFVKLIQQRAASPHLIVGRSFTESTTFNPDLAESINQFMKGNRAAIKRISSIERNPKPREANANIITNEFTNKSYVPSRKVNDKPTQKISSLFLQPKRPQNQPRSQTASRVVRVNFNVGSDNEETKELNHSFALQGHRTFSSKPAEIKERPVKVMSVNLMSNLLYSKERFSNMQKLLDNFLVDDKK